MAANGYLLPVRDQGPAAVDQLVPQNPWWFGLLSTCLSHCENINSLWKRGGTFCSKLGHKLEATFKCLCCSCFVLANAINEQETIFFKQSGVVYLYLFLSFTVVINLVVPLGIGHVAENIRKYFILICIILALTKMLFLWLIADPRPRADYPSNALMRVFYQGGLYLFGFSSFGYSIAIVVNNIMCDNPVDATVTAMMALYIVVQILFLNRFYKTRIPADTFCIQIVLAHLLGTNLTMWFWILCTEVSHEESEDSTNSTCASKPIPVAKVEKYFSPLFVEYLLIAASLFYQMWQDLLPVDGNIAPHCRTCACQLHGAENGEAEQQPIGVAAGIRATLSGSLGLGTCTGFCFAVVFTVLVIISFTTGSKDQSYHVAYSAGIITLYLIQIFTCYIILLCVQSLAWDNERASVDHEDALLYISLVGSLLWAVFHLYSLLLTDIDSSFDTRKPVPHENVRHLDIAADALAMVQYMFQTVTLIRLRQHQRTPGRSTTWLCQCILFLVATNLGFWLENSFYVGIDISAPGERNSFIQSKLKPVGYILRPLIIFFRFHSTVCCLIAWSIFRSSN